MTPTVLSETYLHSDADKLLRTRCRVVQCETSVDGIEVAQRENVAAIIPGPIWEFSGSVLDQIPSLLVIGRPGIGVNAIDLDAATDRGVMVINTPDAPTVSTAEHTLSLMMAAVKRHKAFARLLNAGESLLTETPMVELAGKVLGLVGLGRVGKNMAHICGEGLRMKVVAYDPYVSEAQAAEFGVTLYSDLQEVLRIADIVSIHCPPSAKTNGLIDAAAFRAMKPTAYLINCARGTIVDEAALTKALRDGEIAGAGLDVFDPEPPSPSNPLFAMDNVVATPHSAGYTVGCQRAMGVGVAEQILDILQGVRPSNLVNPEVWDSPKRRELVEKG